MKKDIFSKLCREDVCLSCIVCFCAGLLTIFASAPFFFWIFLLFGFSLFADSVYHSNVKYAIIKSLLFGIGYHVANFHWIIFSLVDDFVFLIPFAIVFICLGFALIMLFHMIPVFFFMKKYKNPVLYYLIISLSWFLFEISKEFFPFGGLPWQGIGMIFCGNDYLIQNAYYFGINGCNIIVILTSFLPFLMINYKYGKKIGIVFIIIYILMFFNGYNRLKNRIKNESLSKMVAIGVQGNIGIDITKSFGEDDAGVKKYISDSQIIEDLKQDNILLIWPESAFGIYNNEDLRNGGILEQVMKFIPKNVKYLIFGSLYVDKEDFRVYNRISVIGREKILVDHYNKMRLVPFGEYMPFRKFFPFLVKTISGGMIDLTPGEKYKLLEIEDLKIAPIICFESVFANKLWKNVIQDADFILQVSNDAWFGNSIGPYQHLAFAKILSIINKKPFIRVSNNGISATYNEYGILQQSSLLNTQTILYTTLPKKTL